MTSINKKRNPESPPELSKDRFWTYDELNAVKNEKDWLVYGDSVYNVKPFIPHHPGGELLIKHLLYTDVTDHLGKFHPKYVTEEKLPNYYMGKIAEKSFPTAFLRSRTPVAVAFRKLEEEMVKEGLFKPAYFYYIREIIKVVLLWTIAIKICLSGTVNVSYIVAAAFLHAFGNQQMAFLLHDASHNEIT